MLLKRTSLDSQVNIPELRHVNEVKFSNVLSSFVLEEKVALLANIGLVALLKTDFS